MQLVLQPLVGRNRRDDALLRRKRQLRRRLLAERARQRRGPLEITGSIPDLNIATQTPAAVTIDVTRLPTGR
jgi:hypothetical protein